MTLRQLIFLGAIAAMRIVAAEDSVVRTSVYLRGSEQGRVVVGDPLRVAVVLTNAVAAPIRLEGAPGQSWTSLVRVRLHDAAGRSIGGPATAAGAPLQAQVEITGEHPATAIFRWPGNFTAGLAPGIYRISARWAPPNGPRSPAGEVSLVIEPDPVNPTPAQRVRREFALAMDAHLTGDRERATLLVERVLAAEPGHADAQRLRRALSARPSTASAPVAPVAGKTNPLPAARPAAAPATTTPAVSPPATAAMVWAASARASSEYRSTDYGAGRAAGAPDVPRASDHRNAWTPKLPDAGPEWLELTYAPAVAAKGVRVVQSFNPGAITGIEVIDDQGKVRTVWTGPDRTAYAAGAIAILETEFAPGERPVARVRVTLDTKSKPGAQAIDAVGLMPAR